MTGRSNCYIKKIFIGLLILSGLTVSLYSQSKIIGGVINVYKNVTAIGPGTDNVTLSNVSSLAVNDTVLLIQMKGAIINEVETASYGSLKDYIGKPGKSEFLIIQSIASNTVTFTSNILNIYSVLGAVQLIRVPYYNSATVKTELTCQPWDSISKTGGVLTMIVGKTLSLNADINVTGKGFIGGSTSSGAGNCLATNIPIYDKYSYPVSSNLSGYKGESQVIKVFIAIGNEPSYFPGYAKGKGANFTGGGGGNGRFSGGGGGANYGFGGRGGREIGTCLDPRDGGIRGWQVLFTDLDSALFLGSGGGSSTYLGGTATPGANGGGIIMIMCDTLKGKGKVIKADGGSPSVTASGNAGAGGGGGGGSIALFQQSFGVKPDSSLLTISAGGGKGGNNAGAFGEGGGGGGGLINTNNISFPGNITRAVSGGAVGTRSGGATGGTGTSGEVRTSFAPVLNGFLFNSIRSSVTGTQVDSTCSNMLPPKISGTKPVGGTLPYTYLWEKSYDQAAWTSLTNDADPTNYTPTVIENNTVYFRRTVTDANATPLVDISKVVKIIVQPAITGNLVGKDTTICYGQDPLSLVPLNSGPSNGSSHNYYLYRWIQNNTDTGWGTSPSADGTFTNAGYDPPALTDTTYYQRVVTSSRCVDYSATVTITVLPLITGNTITQPDEVICEGSLFTLLSATAAGGGDLSYKYQWQDSIATSLNYLPAVGTNTGTTYTPDTSTFSVVEQRYLSRVVFSGPDSVCQDRSNPILLTRYHKIANNTISADQTIGYDSIPAPLTGSDPLDGDLSYTYQWESMIKSIPWAAAVTIPNTSRDYSPANLTDTTWYRRIVNSSVCADTSIVTVVNVHDLIIKNTISFVSGAVEDTICSGSVPAILKGAIPEGGTSILGDYSYKWYSSLTGGPLQSEWSAIAGSTAQDYQPVALTQTTYFRREVGSPVVTPTAVSQSNNIKITVLPLISNSITGIDSVCYDTQPLTPFGVSIGGGDGTYRYTWQDSTDAAGWTNIGGYVYSATATYQPPVLFAESKYRRIVYSGSNDCCINTSNALNIGIHPLPTATIISTADTTICEGSDVSLRISLTGASKWNIVYNENSTPVSVNNIGLSYTTILRKPVTTTSLTTFNYSLSSVIDQNGCIATSLSGARKADVYKVPAANAGPDMSVCGPTVVLAATPSVGTGTWSYPAAVVASTVNNPSMTVTIDSTFSGANISHWFNWEEVNWQCRDKDSVKITFDKRIYSVDAGPVDTTIYTFDNIIHMVADPVLTGTGLWTVVSGTGDFDDNTYYQATVSNLSVDNTFKWKVTNGMCSLEDLIKVYADQIIPREGFSPNNDNINDTYIIPGLDLVNQDAELVIFNGAGTQVFSTSDQDGQEWSDWDGKNSRGIDLPEGTYYFILKIISKGTDPPKVLKKSGFIILKRY